MITIVGLVFLVFVLLIVFAAIKKKPVDQQGMPSSVQQFMQTAEPAMPRYASIRDQQLAEDAALMASEFQRMQEDQKRAQIREGLEVAAAYSAMQAAKRQEKLQAMFVKQSVPA